MFQVTVRARTAVAAWRAWNGAHHVVLGCAGIIVLHLWSGPVDVPGREEIDQIIWPLVPTLLALASLSGALCAHRAGETITPRGAPVVRATYLAALTALAGALLVASGPIADRWVLARNDALLCGLALLAAELLPRSVAWTPLVLVPMATWLLGSNGLGFPPEPWAVLLEPAGSARATATAMGIVATGAIVYVGRPVSTEVRRARLRARSVSGARSGRSRPSRRGCCSPRPRR